MNYFIADAEPAAFVCLPANLEWISDCATPHGMRPVFTLDGMENGEPDDPAALLYTPGITGRSKDRLISGGYNVYPQEIDTVPEEMAGIRESAVIGLPHADFGEAVPAVVVPQPGIQLGEAQIITKAKAKIAHFKVPKSLLRDQFAGK